MSHSFFSSSREREAQQRKNGRDTSPLLPLHESPHSVRLQDLSPRPSISISGSSRVASPSPPASFYRDSNNNAARIGLGHGNGDGSGRGSPAAYRDMKSYDGEGRRGLGSLSLSQSPSPERKRRIQFAAPPPPLVAAPGMGSSFLGSKNMHVENGRSGSQGSIPASREWSSPLGSIRGAGGAAVDSLLVLERKERALQVDLQTLLDAQSTGLIKGLGAGAEIDATSEGSSTPTAAMGSRTGRSGGGGGIIPVRQPKRKTISLRGARRGVSRVMDELAGIKSEEGHTLDFEVERREQALSQMHVWEERMEGVRNQLEDNASAGDDLADLQKESQNLGTQIRDLEDKLLQLRARQRWVEERITEGVNKREAKLSSYRGALKEVEKEVKEFLKRPPILTTTTVLPEIMDEQSFLTLKPERRTLGMAREWWEREVSALQVRKGEVEFEKQALEDGGVLWDECITAINSFEDELRKEMTADSADGTEGLRKQITKMDGVTTLLEDKLRTCEDKGWKLLLVAVGAELEAFKEGKKMLLAVLGEIEPTRRNQQSSDSEEQDPFANGGDDHEHHGHNPNMNELHVLDGEVGASTREDSFLTAPEPEPETQTQEMESEDEEPNLDELLVDSRHRRSESS